MIRAVILMPRVVPAIALQLPVPNQPRLRCPQRRERNRMQREYHSSPLPNGRASHKRDLSWGTVAPRPPAPWTIPAAPVPLKRPAAAAAAAAANLHVSQPVALAWHSLSAGGGLAPAARQLVFPTVSAAHR